MSIIQRNQATLLARPMRQAIEAAPRPCGRISAAGSLRLTSTCRQLILAVVCVLGILAAGANAASGAAAPLLTTAEARTAFRSVGLPLAQQDIRSPNWTVLYEPKPYANGYDLRVIVFTSRTTATVGWDASVRDWRFSGYAIRRVANVLVVVIPAGSKLGVEHRPTAMPSTVARAVTALANRVEGQLARSIAAGTA